MIVDQILTHKLEDAVTLITPAMAEEMLQGNTDNRKFSKRISEDYQRQMKLGRWRRSPEPLVITDQGRIISAQHRLNAVIETGLAQEFMVVLVKDEDFNEVFGIVDQGKTRTAADVLQTDRQLLTPLTFLLRVAGVKSVKAEDIEPLWFEEPGRLLNLFDQIKTKGKTWRSTGFRAAAIVAYLEGSVKINEILNVYERLNCMDMGFWPHLFGAYFKQINDSEKPLYANGRSVADERFCRALYTWRNYATHTRTIRITQKSLDEMDVTVKKLIAEYLPDEPDGTT